MIKPQSTGGKEPRPNLTKKNISPQFVRPSCISIAMDCLDSIIACVAGRNQPAQQPHYVNEKIIITSQPVPYADDAAAQFIETIRTAEFLGKGLEDRLATIIATNGWKENLAERILHGLEKLVKDGAKTASAMEEATKKVTNTALGLAKEHPYYTALVVAGTIVAIGVLVLVAPWVLEALGFAARGPRLGKSHASSHIQEVNTNTWEIGSFAARWMSQIARSEGEVSKDSIYAFLQRLGMTWK